MWIFLFVLIFFPTPVQFPLTEETIIGYSYTLLSQLGW